MKGVKLTFFIFTILIPCLVMGRVVFPEIRGNHFTPKICDKKEFSSGIHQVNLIELYTSEGCSSCPPADKWFNSLYKHQKLWSKFIPIKFHVDYWNYLGWKDPFSKKIFTKRQRKYSKEWKSEVVYTPGFVFNGAEWKHLIPPLLELTYKLRPGILKAKRSKNNNFKVNFKPEIYGKKKLKIFAAILGNGLSSHIKRGENMGTRLNHNFVVLDIQSRIVRPKSGKYKTNFKFIKPLINPKEYSVAFWVSNPNNLKPIQAVAGCAENL